MSFPWDPYVEFYVTCNPPLVPRGVDFVFRALDKEFTDADLIERLYEPEIPWIKVIAARESKQRIMAVLHRFLLQVVEEDCDLLDTGHAERSGAAHGQAPADVKIIAKAPRVTPWSSFQSACFRDDGIPSSHCFPDTEDMQCSTHRAVWRGLESTNGWRVNDFLQVLASQWGHAGAPSTLEDLQTLLDCKISHNLAANLMYIGSKHDRHQVEMAVQKLDNFLDIILHSTKFAHLIVPEGSGPYRLAYRWLSHVGQNQSTYILERAGAPSDEYRRLSRAVTLRAERQDENGQWVTDKPSGRSKTGLKPGAAKSFDPFHGYEYTKKQPSAVHQHFKAIAEAQGARKQGRGNKDEKAIVSLEANPKEARVYHLQSEREMHSIPPRLVQNHEHSLQGVNDDLTGASVRPSSKLPEAAQACLSRSDVASWRDDVGRAQTDLLSFDDSPQDSPTFDTQSLAAAVGDLEPGRGHQGRLPTDSLLIFETDDLICLEDAYLPEGPTPFSAEALNDHLLDLAIPTEQRSLQPDFASSAKIGTDNANRNILDEAIPHLPYFEIPHGAISRTMEAAAESERAGTDCQSRQKAGKSHLLKMVEDGLEELANVLPLVPGNASIAVRFGRFYRKNLSHSLVDVGSGPYWTMGDMVESLNDVDLQNRNIGFSTALTTCGPDMNDLIQKHATGKDAWVLDRRRDWYEIFCTTEDNETFVMELDAKTFEYRCRSEEKEIGCLFLHCVHRPWDMQICISHSTLLDKSPMHMAMAKALTASITITNTKNGELALETTTDPGLKTKVDAILMRHDAQYRLGAQSHSILSVKLTKKLIRGPRLERREQWRTDRTSSTRKGTPREWYEASLLSLGAQEIFRENAALSFGDRASWRSEQLRDQGIFEALCQSALGMISQFDSIGLLNDNGLRIKDEVIVHDTVAEAKERKGVEVFW